MISGKGGTGKTTLTASFAALAKDIVIVDVIDEFKIGDVNHDNIVDIIDALLIAQYFVGLNPTGFYTDVADVNFDGLIDIVDTLLVAQACVRLIELPPE